MVKRERIKLSEEDIRTLKELEEDIEWLREEIERAKRVGIDVSDIEEQFRRAVALRENLLREYGE